MRGIFQIFRNVPKTSYRDNIRALSQWLEQIPVLGLLFMVPIRNQGRPMIDTVVTLIAGALAIWFPAFWFAIRSAHVTVAPFELNVLDAVSKGDVLILVPSVIAPVFLFFFGTDDTVRRRRHQNGLMLLSVILAGFAIVVYLANFHPLPDRSFLMRASVIGAIAAAAIVYAYFLLTYLPTDLVETMHSSSSSLTDEVLALRKRKTQ